MEYPNIEKARIFAENQLYKVNDTGNTDDCIGFDFKGVFIINPWTDETGRFPFTTDEAIKYYGLKNMCAFCKEAIVS